MSLSLLKNAVFESRFTATQKQTIKQLQDTIGIETTRRIVESFDITPDDYDNWLRVIRGVAQDKGMNINTRRDFMDVAFAVLENDPANLPYDVQTTVAQSLWAKQKAEKSHKQVEKAVRAKEEEEQLKFALKKFRNRSVEDEQQSTFTQAYNDAFEDEEDCCEVSPEEVDRINQRYRSGQIDFKTFKDELAQAEYSARNDRMSGANRDDMTWDRDRTKWNDDDRSNGQFNYDEFEDEEFFPEDEFEPNEFEDDLGDRDRGFDDDMYLPDDEDFDEEPEFGDEPSDFDDFEDPRDADIARRGNELGHSRDLEDWDPSSDEAMDRDAQTIQRGRDIKKSRHLSEIEPRQSKPKSFYAAEQEEVGKNYNSPFKEKQLVTLKKDGGSYRVAIPDGPGDQVGIMVGGRLKMVPSKDLEPIAAAEDEESTSKHTSSSNKVSFLHDVLTGTNSHESMRKLQDEIVTQGANVWTKHHAAMPKNPHPKGSIAWKAWEKGVKQAASEVWAPKPVFDPKKAKNKPKPKKK